MRRSAVALLTAALLAATPTATAAPRGQIQEQQISLSASAPDGSVHGIARLYVQKERSGYRVKGYVEAISGCVELKAVNMHLGSYLGGDQITKTCKPDVEEPVNAWTGHTDIVLSAIVDGGPDWDSSIVTLTGK
ncbi:hypothetical protein AB0K51_18915 [Kitasatospora sp. NPDC049285]|uniref:hypothetical protein n=1 Tax=Kitasatospora sp. NPDC049285 TaxID=3157096 RepID=UPI0034213F91